MIIITIPRRESQDTKFNKLRHKMSTQVKSNKRLKATNTGATNEDSRGNRGGGGEAVFSRGREGIDLVVV
jgi:hypothetical protein